MTMRMTILSRIALIVLCGALLSGTASAGASLFAPKAGENRPPVTIYDLKRMRSFDSDIPLNQQYIVQRRQGKSLRVPVILKKFTYMATIAIDGEKREILFAHLLLVSTDKKIRHERSTFTSVALPEKKENHPRHIRLFTTRKNNNYLVWQSGMWLRVQEVTSANDQVEAFYRFLVSLAPDPDKYRLGKPKKVYYQERFKHRETVSIPVGQLVPDEELYNSQNGWREFNTIGVGDHREAIALAIRGRRTQKVFVLVLGEKGWELQKPPRK